MWRDKCSAWTRALSSKRAARSLTLLGALTLAPHCSPSPPSPPTPIIVRVRSDAGEPIAEASVFSGSSLLATTDGQGVAHLEVRGRDGESFSLQVRCPPAYSSPEQALDVRRLDIVTKAKVPEYEVRCVKLRHSLVVAVRAENGPNLPVMYLDKEVARTDAFGAAHVVFEMNVHERVELTLQTEGKEYTKAHPQNPMSVFEMAGHDDLQVFAVTFTKDPKKRPPRAAPAPTISTF